jgi:hypothetical protein
MNDCFNGGSKREREREREVERNSLLPSGLDHFVFVGQKMQRVGGYFKLV